MTIRRTEDGSVLERDMSTRAPDVPEQVRHFAPKEKPPPEPKEAPPRSDGDVLDQAGQAIVGLLQHAAKLSNETRERVMEQARKLSHQLHAAEGRIDQLPGGDRASPGPRRAGREMAVSDLPGDRGKTHPLTPIVLSAHRAFGNQDTPRRSDLAGCVRLLTASVHPRKSDLLSLVQRLVELHERGTDRGCRLTHD